MPTDLLYYTGLTANRGRAPTDEDLGARWDIALSTLTDYRRVITLTRPNGDPVPSLSPYYTAEMRIWALTAQGELDGNPIDTLTTADGRITLGASTVEIALPAADIADYTLIRGAAYQRLLIYDPVPMVRYQWHGMLWLVEQIQTRPAP